MKTEKMKKLFWWYGNRWSDVVSNDREVEAFRAGMRQMRWLIEMIILFIAIQLFGIFVL